MFSFPCEQTAGGEAVGCDISKLRDNLIGRLIGLARATEGNEYIVSDATAAVTVEGLCATLANRNLGESALLAIMDKVDTQKRKLVPSCYTCAASCGRTDDYDMGNLRGADEDIRSLKSLILFGIRSIAANACHVTDPGCMDASIHNFLYKGLFAIGRDDWGMEELLPIVLEAGDVSRRCMALSGNANTVTFGHPEDGSALPVFISPNVCNWLAEKLPAAPVSTSEEILKLILG